MQCIQAGCKKLSCRWCGEYKAKVYKRAIAELADREKLIRMVTLTLDPGLIPPTVNSVRYIQRVWNRFRIWIRDHKGIKLHYVRCVELQQNGTAHYHLLWRECISQDEIIKAWTECGGGHQCRISIPKHNKGPGYVSKYISKRLAEELGKGTRVVATSRGLILFPATLPSGWAYTKLSFYYAYQASVFPLLLHGVYTETPKYFEHYKPPNEERPWTWNDTLLPPRTTNGLFSTTWGRAT